MYICARIFLKSNIITHTAKRQLIVMADNVVFNSLDSILKVLNENKHEDATVSKLLEIYDSVRTKVPGLKKHPLIVFEGFDGSGKSTITKCVARNINGMVLQTPPPIMHSIRNYFDTELHFRSPYYYLGNYVAAIQMAEMLQSRPVLLDRYWYSTVAYALAEKVRKNPNDFQLPDANDEIYKWPEDLLKPDAVYFLQVDEDKRLQRLSRRNTLTDQEMELQNNQQFRDNILTVYKSFKNPSIQMVDSNESVKRTVEKVHNIIKPLL